MPDLSGGKKLCEDLGQGCLPASRLGISDGEREGLPATHEDCDSPGYVTTVSSAELTIASSAAVTTASSAELTTRT
ncbi:MAG: hypothetical protein V3V08_05840 [Nannocystaceae bacterium]